MKNNTVQTNIPIGWQETNLGSIADLYQPQTISKEQMSLYGQYLVFGANGVIGKFDKFNHEDSEVIVTCRGASCGSVSMTPSQAWITGNAMVIKVDEDKVLKPYIYYFLKNSDLNSVVSGGAQPQITRQPISAFKILFPQSKTEQQKIAEILGGVDEDIAKTQEVIGATEKLKRGLMQQLFTRGIGHTKFKKTKFGEIPEGWEVSRFGEIARITNGQVDPKKEPYKHMSLVAPNHVESDSGRIIYNETAEEQGAISGKYFVDKGDVIYSKIRPYLKKVTLAYEECLCSADMYPIKGMDGFDNVFLFYILLSDSFTDFANSNSARTGIPKINRDELNGYEFALPPLNEQLDIARILSAVDEKISVNKKLKEKLTLLKKGLMQDLLSGRVRTI